MSLKCPQCHSHETLAPEPRMFRKMGFFVRKSDRVCVQRYKCLKCGKGFSDATNDPCLNQNKRQMNGPLYLLLSSGMSMRRSARNLKIHRRTIKRKLLFLANQAKLELEALRAPVSELQFDDLETFEHTKCKPLSVTMAVEKHTRRILGFRVARMPAKGKLAAIARKKYGYRKDERGKKRRELFAELRLIVEPGALIESDSNPHYFNDVKRFFPDCHYETVLGGRGAITGQGELKKKKFDPLFSLNHTYAKLRADINRLFRKTWCTTKRPEMLAAHLTLYSHYHNAHLGKVYH